MLIRCHQFCATFSIRLESAAWAAMRGPDGDERFGKLTAAVRRACNGWQRRLVFDWEAGRVEVTVTAPKHVDMDRFVDEVRVRTGMAQRAIGLMPPDEAQDARDQMLLDRIAQPKEPPKAGGEQAVTTS